MKLFQFVFIFGLIVSAIPVFAQEGAPSSGEEVVNAEMQMVAVADVNVGDVEVTEKDGTFEGTFTLEGRMGLQDNIVLGAVVRNGAGEVVAVQSFGTTSALEEGELRSVSFAYMLPERLGGKLSIGVVAETESGLPLGYALVAEVSRPEKESVFSCLGSSTPKDIVCTHTKGGVLAVASFNDSPLMPADVTNEYGLEKGVPTTISLPTKSGRFTLHITDTTTGELFVTKYYVRGDHATVHNLTLQKSEGKSTTLKGTLAAEVSVQDGFQTVVELRSYEGAPCGKTDLKVQGPATQFEIETTCEQGIAKVTIQGTDGTALDVYETTFRLALARVGEEKGSDAGMMSKTMRTLGVVMALFIVMLTVLGMRKLIERGVLTFMFLLACVLGGYMVPQSAHALTLTAQTWGPYGCGACEIGFAATANISNNQSSYIPGETIQVTTQLFIEPDMGMNPTDRVNAVVAYNGAGPSGPPVWDASWPGTGTFPVTASTGGYRTITFAGYTNTNVQSFTIPGSMTPGTHSFANRLTVNAQNGSGQPIDSDVATGNHTFTVVAGTPPSTPSNFDVVPYNQNCATPGQGRMDLSWNAVSGATGYTVRINNTTTGSITTVSTGVTTYIHSGLSAVHRIEYSVRADNGSVSSAWTTPKPMVVCAPPTPPNFSASANACGAGGGVRLTWTAVNDLHWAGYQIFRNDPGFGWVAIATVPSAAATSYIDLTAPAGVSSSYRIEAQAVADSEPSSASSATAPTCVPPGQPDLVPSAPSVNVTSVVQGGTITFNTNTISNSGTVAAGPHNVGGFYIDGNGDAVTDYIVAIPRQTNSTSAGGSYSQTVNWTVPLGATPGTNYRARYIVDTAGEVTESNEGNNASAWSTSFRVVAASTACRVDTSVGGSMSSWYPPSDSDFDDYWMRFADPNLNFVASNLSALFRERACATSPLDCNVFGYFFAGAATTRPPVPAACAVYAPQCSNGIDDDGDGVVDTADPGCHPDGNAGNASSYSPTDSVESNPPTNAAPNMPTVTGPTTPYGLYPFEPITYTFGATDPEGDPLRFVIDVDNDGSTNDVTPSVGYVSSGGTQIGNYSWTTPGTKFVAIRAVDDKGATSSPRIVSVDLILAAPVLTLPTHTTVTESGATLGATVASKGGTATMSARGTCWSTSNPPPTLPSVDCLPEGLISNGAFSHPRIGMPGNTTIYYWGFATNNIGTGYSPVGTFTTLAPSAPSLTFSGSPLSITAGDTVTLTWTVTGTATRCTATGGWTGDQSHTGTNNVQVNPTTNTTYSLECWNGTNSSGRQDVTVSVSSVGCSADTNFNRCELPAGTSGDTEGQCAVGYVGNCQYRCNGVTGIWEEISNTCVVPLITRFELCDLGTSNNCISSPTEMSVPPGAQATIHWESEGTTACTNTSGPGFSGGGPDGSADVTASLTPGDARLFSLICTGSNGTPTSRREVILRTDAVAPVLTASDAIVTIGDDVTLSWNTNNPLTGGESTCSITGGGLSGYASLPGDNGTVTTGWSDPIEVRGRTTYTLSCGPGLTDTVTVDVVAENWES